MKKPDLPDLAGLKNKFNFNKIVNSIADAVDSNKPLSKVDPDDAIGNKIAELDAVVTELLKVHQQHVDDLNKVSTLLKGVFDDVNRLRDEVKSNAPKEAAVEEPAAKAEEPSAKAEEPAAKAEEPAAKAEEPAAKAEEPAEGAEEDSKKSDAE